MVSVKAAALYSRGAVLVHLTAGLQRHYFAFMALSQSAPARVVTLP
jgi:hypothetical protein